MRIPQLIIPVLLVAAFAWWVLFEWLRDRSYRKHIHTGFAPGTQRLALIGTLGALTLIVAGFILVLLRRGQ